MVDVATVTNLDLLFVFVISVIVAVVAWQNRPQPGASTLAAFVLLVAAWELAHLLAHITPATGLFRRLRWLGIGSVAFVWFLFVLSYVGRDDLVTARSVALALAWPVTINGALWLSEIARLADLGFGASVWTGLYDGASGLYWTHIALSYGLFLLGSALLIRFLWRSHRVFRAQGLAILLGVGALWVGSVITVFEVFGDIHVHFLPAGLTLMGMAFLWATTRGRLTDLMPVAASAVVGTVDAGVLVVDRDERVVEANDTVRELFDVPPSADVVGQPLSDVPAGTDPGIDHLTSIDGDEATLLLDGRTVRFSPSRLRDDRGRASGRVYLCTDVTDQRRRETRLRHQKTQLERFSRIISHDLRNPLNVATGRLDLARETGDLEHLDDAEHALERIEKIIEQTLTLARQGQTVERDALEPVNLAHAATESWRTVETAGATLDVETDLVVVADRDRLRHVLENLFRNAIDHGGDTVAVRIGTLPDRDGFYVADDGPGIPPDEREAVFEAGHSTSSDGTGLGLQIVAEIVEAFGWDITITDGSDGGARFEITGVDLPAES